MIDEFVLYNSAISAERVKLHYQEALKEPPAGTRPAGVASVTLSNGSIVIEFQGTLKNADNVLGPYTKVPGARSPFSISANPAARCFIAQ